MKRIFISGALNGFSEETGFIDNVHLMLRYAHDVRSLGAAVYVPCNDILTSFSNGGLPHHEYYKHDLTWLRVCDALALVPNPNNNNSKGVMGELEEAKELGIPILEDIGMGFNSLQNMPIPFREKETFFLKRSYTEKENTKSGEIILYPLYACNCKEYIEIISDEALEEEKEENLCCQLRGKSEEDGLPSLYLHMNQHTYKVLIEGYWNLWGE